MSTLKLKHPSSPAEFARVDLMQKDAPDVQFDGKLVGAIDSRTVDTRGRRDAERYTRLELYELESGKWVAAAVACSDRNGEVDMARVTEIPVAAYKDERQRAVLEAFGWTWLAKAFADHMGWDHVQVIS